MANEKGRMHESAAETRERNYDRLRETGVRPDAARQIAEQGSRELHEKLDRRR
jgi:hypothetical protein